MELRLKPLHGNSGRKMSEETKRKLSKAKSNPSEETRKKMSEARMGITPWNKGVPMSEETKRKLSKAKSNPSEETRKKMSEAAMGKKKSKEFCKNRSEYMKKHNHFKGKKHTEESKRKMSLALTGKSAWMKGKKHKEESLIKMRAWVPTKETRKKMSLAKQDGFVPWNKGKTGIYSEETKRKISKANKGNTYRRGAKHTAETIAKMKGKIFTAATRKKMSIAQRKRVVPFKDSTIEVRVQKFLKNLKIKFIPHKYMGDIKYSYQCDMFVPVQKGISQKTVIECDGDYWHGNVDIIPASKLPQHRKVQRCLDYERTAQLEEAGFTVIRLPEHEIREMDEDKFKERLLVAC